MLKKYNCRQLATLYTLIQTKNCVAGMCCREPPLQSFSQRLVSPLVCSVVHSMLIRNQLSWKLFVSVQYFFQIYIILLVTFNSKLIIFFTLINRFDCSFENCKVLEVIYNYKKLLKTTKNHVWQQRRRT